MPRSRFYIMPHAGCRVSADFLTVKHFSGLNKDLDRRCRTFGFHGRSPTGSDYHPQNLRRYRSTVSDARPGTSAPDAAEHKTPCNDVCLCIDWDNLDMVTESCSPLPALSGDFVPRLGNTGEPLLDANVPKTNPSNKTAKKVPCPLSLLSSDQATDEGGRTIIFPDGFQPATWNRNR
jgi:hypothetical protein